MIIVPLLIIVFIFIVRFQKGMFAALLVIVATKSIMDAFWEVRLGPLSFAAVGGILIPILFFKILKRIRLLPNFYKNQARLLVLALSLGLVFGLLIKPIASLEVIIVNLNVYFAFLMMPILVNTPKRFQFILWAIMIGGIFPILVSLYQYQTGVIFQERQAAGLTRYVGFYHDAFPVRFYGLMTLFASLLHLTYFKVKGKLILIGILLLSIGALFSIYLIFSKAAVGILGLWVVLLLVFSKSRFRQLIALGIAVGVIALVFGDVIFANLEQLFYKEIGYQTGTIKDARFTLAGRGYIWEDYWYFWVNEQNLFFQFFGDGLSRPSHNEFLRILLVSGILGLVLFVFLIFKMTIYIFKYAGRFKVFSLMLLGMFVIDCIGLTPGNYYYYNILLWGFLGLFFNQTLLSVQNAKRTFNTY